jgi:predicted dehydrogenase
MSNERLRFAVFGAGDFGPQFAGYIAELGDVVALSEPNPDARARFGEITGLEVSEYDDHQSLIAAEKIDVVAITSPNFTHREIALAGARAGCHVYCEKAMANTVPECWEMVRACREAGVRLMVGHKRRLRPPWARMIELKEQLGAPLAITSCAYHDARQYDHQGWWTRRDACGGLLPVIGVHIVDWMRAMCGDVATVRAVSPPQVDTRYDFPDTMHVTLTFHSGAVATLAASLVFPPWKFREAGGPIVMFENGGLRFEPFMDHLDISWQHREDPTLHHERFDDLGFDHAYRLELGDFVKGIDDPGYRGCLGWEEGLRCVEIMEAADRSAVAGGELISLPLYPELEDEA